jgi:hypothetical protein
MILRMRISSGVFIRPTNIDPKPIGEGPFAIVYKAKLEDRDVALKVMKPPLAEVCHPVGHANYNLVDGCFRLSVTKKNLTYDCN